MTYYGSEQWDKDVLEAMQKFRLVHDSGPDLLRRYVSAEAGTGSRYAVVATRLPDPGPLMEGGPMVVTVLSPWQDAWAMADSGELHSSYVAEHLTAGRYRDQRLHGGDLAALTLTIAHALRREAVPNG